MGILDKAHERREREEEEEEEDLVYCVEGGTGALNCIQFCYAQYLTCSNLSLPVISPSLSPSLPLYPSPSPLFLSLCPLPPLCPPPSLLPSLFLLSVSPFPRVQYASGGLPEARTSLYLTPPSTPAAAAPREEVREGVMCVCVHSLVCVCLRVCLCVCVYL